MPGNNADSQTYDILVILKLKIGLFGDFFLELSFSSLFGKTSAK